MNVSIEKKIAAIFGVTVLVLLLVAFAAGANAIRFDAMFQRVDHTHRVLTVLEQVSTGVFSLQTKARSFALTGSEDTIRSFDTTKQSVARAVKQLRRLTADNPVEQQTLDRLDPLLAKGNETLLERTAARQVQGFEPVWKTPAFLTGLEAAENVHQLVDQMGSVEQRLLEDRVARTRRAARETVGAAAIGGVCAIGFIVASGLLVRRDFRARQTVEEALRQSEERFRQMIESIKDYAIIMLDASGRVVSWNAGAERIKGYPAAEIVGRYFSCFYPPEAVQVGAPGRGRVARHGGRTWAEGTEGQGASFYFSLPLTPQRIALES